MQPGRPFLRSLHATFLMHMKGKVHCESQLAELRRSKTRRGIRAELACSQFETSDIGNRVLTALKSWPKVDPTKVTEFASFEEDLELERGDVVVLVLSVLHNYGLNLSYVDARRMTTCSDLIDYIQSQFSDLEV